MVNFVEKIVKAKLAFLFAFCATIAMSPLSVLAQSQSDASKKNDSEWISYRDAYKAMLWFEKYGKSKNLIQNRFQIVVKDKSINFENVRLSLNSQTSVMNLSLDALGQTQLPLLKAAYIENAELNISPRLGQFTYRSRVSLQLRADGHYEMSDLRAACEQSLQFLAYMDPNSVSGKKCVGVKFAFDKRDSLATVELRTNGQHQQNLSVQDNTPIWPDSGIQLRVANLRFDANIEKVQVVTRGTPLIAIGVIE
ncbi:MAG: hypothetical protein E6Q34_01350 [Burkholderiaceae bacterium]|nr:MAG: hypothetical protein E6Q34_01350 [Burkholderiaceae bacterium]